MTLDDIRKRRDQLAEDIGQLLSDFHDETGVSVQNVSAMPIPDAEHPVDSWPHGRITIFLNLD